MLIPKGMAKEATEGNIRNLEKQKSYCRREARGAGKAAAQEQAKILEKITLEIKTKGGDSGKLFGSITSKDIADALLKREDLQSRPEEDRPGRSYQTGRRNAGNCQAFPGGDRCSQGQCDRLI